LVKLATLEARTVIKAGALLEVLTIFSCEKRTYRRR
jgi:hypothetical protein